MTPWERNLAISSANDDVDTLPHSRHTLWRNSHISAPYMFTSALIIRAKREETSEKPINKEINKL